MKKILYFAVAVLAFASCNKWLDQEPLTELAVSQVYNTYDGALKNVATLYSRLGNVDNGLNTSARYNLPSITNYGSEFEFTSSSSIPTTLWTNYYKYIAQANQILQNLPQYEEQINDTYANSKYDKMTLANPCLELEAEVRFLRAYAYFNLYRYFGAVPLITEPTGPKPAYTPRSDREAVFSFLYDEMNYALANCCDNNSGISYGRVTKGAVAGFLAKAKIFHASYIRRAENFGSIIEESEESTQTTSALYSEAITLCNDIINGKYGTYKLQEYFPSVFTTQNNEILMCCPATEGTTTGDRIPIGMWGSEYAGAGNGQDQTPWQALLLDIPSWEHGSSLHQICYDFGQIDRFNLEERKPGVSIDSLRILYANRQEYTITGDTTRRMWSICKGWCSTSRDAGEPDALWVFEPAAKFLGSEFYIEPSKGPNNYTAQEIAVMDRALEQHERVWWQTEGYSETASGQWDCNWYRLSKFRNPNPSDLPSTFDINYSSVDLPMLRLAEIYLLRAEAEIMSGSIESGIKDINVIRDRACYQSTSRDMFLNQGAASYEYNEGAVMMIPTNLSKDQALKELLFERIRELTGEDDCGWLDLARYPDIVRQDMYDICRYMDPLCGWSAYGDANKGVYLWHIFDEAHTWRVLLPIPYTEFSYFPEMKQNPGY